MASVEAGLRIREDDLVDERGRRMKSVIAELAMTVELQRERIPADGERQPFSEVEVEAMSQALSASTKRMYGLARVLAARRLLRSTFYAHQKRAPHPVPLQGRGPKTAHTDAVLLELIRQAIAGSPFHSEGRRKELSASVRAENGSADYHAVDGSRFTRGQTCRLSSGAMHGRDCVRAQSTRATRHGHDCAIAGCHP